MYNIKNNYKRVQYRLAEVEDFLPIISIAKSLGIELPDEFFSTDKTVKKAFLAQEFADFVDGELCRKYNEFDDYTIGEKRRKPMWFTDHIPMSHSDIENRIKWYNKNRYYRKKYSRIDGWTVPYYKNEDDTDIRSRIIHETRNPIISDELMAYYLDKWNRDWAEYVKENIPDKVPDLQLTLAKSLIKSTKKSSSTKMACIGLTDETTEFGCIFFHESHMFAPEDNDNIVRVYIKSNETYRVSFQNKNGNWYIKKLSGNDIVTANKKYLATRH